MFSGPCDELASRGQSEEEGERDPPTVPRRDGVQVRRVEQKRVPGLRNQSDVLAVFDDHSVEAVRVAMSLVGGMPAAAPDRGLAPAVRPADPYVKGQLGDNRLVEESLRILAHELVE